MDDQTEKPKGNKPSYIAYHVKDDKQGKGFFNPVGAAWAHKDGQGYDVHLDSVPVNGRVTLRELREKQVQDYKNEQHRRPEQEPMKQRNHEPER